jgi:hypothetical protein
LEELRKIVKTVRKIDVLADVETFRTRAQFIAAPYTRSDKGTGKCTEDSSMSATVMTIVTPC